jgi:hypothetical protein
LALIEPEAPAPNKIWAVVATEFIVNVQWSNTLLFCANVVPEMATSQLPELLLPPLQVTP